MAIESTAAQAGFKSIRQKGSIKAVETTIIERMLRMKQEAESI